MYSTIGGRIYKKCICTFLWINTSKINQLWWFGTWTRYRLQVSSSVPLHMFMPGSPLVDSQRSPPVCQWFHFESIGFPLVVSRLLVTHVGLLLSFYHCLQPQAPSSTMSLTAALPLLSCPRPLYGDACVQQNTPEPPPLQGGVHHWLRQKTAAGYYGRGTVNRQLFDLAAKNPQLCFKLWRNRGDTPDRCQHPRENGLFFITFP